jgi:arginyl-tRNA synthetase
VVCQYLYALCKDFSRFFGACSVLHADSPELKAARAQLVDAFGLLLKQGLANLGIQTLERM